MRKKLTLLVEYVYSSTDGRQSAPPSLDRFDSRRAARQASNALTAATQAQTASSPAQTIHYDLLPDGTVVKMVCPVCGAERFRSILGFINHCRLNCKLSFGSQDERLERCGVPVSEEEVPEHLKHLSKKASRELQLVQLRAEVQPTRIVKDTFPEIREAGDTFIDYQSFGLGESVETLLRPALPSHSSKKAFRSSWGEGESRYYLKRKLLIGNAAKCILKSASSLPKEAVMVGGCRPGSHLFKLYLKDLGDPVLPFVRFVRVFLHPAYRPDDVVDLHEAPFTLERPAWGEFPIRIQLHFHDAQRNKPVDLYHQLKIFAAIEGKYLECGQSLHEIDLDKHTDLSVSTGAAEIVEDDAIYVSESEDSSSDERFGASPMSTAGLGEVVNPHFLKYCKYCGLPHHPQTSFGILQKNCAMKPRKMKVSSKSTPWHLFSTPLAETRPPRKAVKALSADDCPIDDSASDQEKLVAALASQLELSCFQEPTVSGTSMLLAATRIFLKGLLVDSARNVPLQTQRAMLDMNFPAVLTPVHLYNAILAREEYDFLSNVYFNFSPSNGKSNSGKTDADSNKRQ